jgi:hypothetical protein
MRESTKDNVIKRCIKLMTEEQIVQLYETFNGGTFDNKSFEEWIEGI